MYLTLVEPFSKATKKQNGSLPTFYKNNRPAVAFLTAVKLPNTVNIARYIIFYTCVKEFLFIPFPVSQLKVNRWSEVFIMYFVLMA